MKAFKFSIWLAVVIGAAVVLWNAAHAVTPSEFWSGCKCTFYAVIIPAIFFYTARAIRAVAKYYEAKTERLEDK